jgi:hypothetical protein
MGLLDDAIREHLELKRRHGADASEIARQEREALGAPRSVAEAAQESASADVDAPAGPAVSELAERPPADEPDLRDLPEPGREPTGGAVAADRFADEVDLDWSDPAPDEPEPEASAEAEGEDVLEETPEFLQETPEHDRLWFEQRPPRDFDF